MMNSSDTEVSGKLTPQDQVTRIWADTGTKSTTIDTLSKLKGSSKLTQNSVAFYQYQFHNTRQPGNMQQDIMGPVYSYSLPNG